MRDHPAWRSWLLIVQLFSVCLQHDVSVDDIQLIDGLQLQHSTEFDNVPEYAGLKRPKHHFCAHLAQDIWQYGPPRGYWCFGYEAFNKVIKGGAQKSGWKNTTEYIMTYWAMRSGRSLVLGARSVTQHV